MQSLAHPMAGQVPDQRIAALRCEGADGVADTGDQLVMPHLRDADLQGALPVAAELVKRRLNRPETKACPGVVLISPGTDPARRVISTED